MRGPEEMPEEVMEPFAKDGDLARLLRAEREASGPSAAARDRIWSGLRRR